MICGAYEEEEEKIVLWKEKREIPGEIYVPHFAKQKKSMLIFFLFCPEQMDLGVIGMKREKERKQKVLTMNL